jgi:salicylate hydroxylase
MSIEDACVLGASIDRHPGDLGAALQAYEAERRPRTARVQLESRERGRTYHLPTRWSQLQRDLRYFWKSLFDPHSSGMQANWVYEYNVTDFERAAGAHP